jgi:hypothetical protein
LSIGKRPHFHEAKALVDGGFSGKSGKNHPAVPMELVLRPNWNVGIVERWNNGLKGMKTIKNDPFPLLDPVFHYSNWGETPVLLIKM